MASHRPKNTEQIREAGQILKHLREQKGVSQRDLAVMVGIPKSTLVNYEQGRREPGITTWVNLLRALGVQIGEWAWAISSAPVHPMPTKKRSGRPRKAK